jgi:hypothetical protein
VNDTERLEALEIYGLCVATHDTLKHGSWERVWVCTYGDRTMMGPTIRDVIDAAVLDINTGVGKPN